MHLRTYHLSIFVAFCLFFEKVEGQLKPTQHTELPPPFSYVENLYLDSHLNFIALGDELYPEKIVHPNLKRSYRLVHIPSDKQALSTIYHDLIRTPIDSLEGTSLILMESSSNYFSHFFHLLEHLVGAWAFYGHQWADQIRRVILVTEDLVQFPNWQGPNQINDHVLRALFPNAVVKIWSDFVREQHQPICFERALISDRAISGSNPECLKINKHLGAALPFIQIQSTNLESLAHKVQSYAGTAPQESSDLLHVTYLKRPPLRCLTAQVERDLIHSISKIPSVAVQVRDFATLSFQEQINTIGHTDVLISVHGNGLSHILFLPKGAAVIELFPPNTHHLDYRLFADARGLDYFGILYQGHTCLEREEAYRIGHYCHTPNPMIPELDINLILSVIKSRL